jgi:hypothetical protein
MMFLVEAALAAGARRHMMDKPAGRQTLSATGESGATIVEWKFESLSDGTTFVRVRNYGFAGDADQLVKSAADSGQGFTWVLAGMKAYLEHNVELNLVVDRFPKEVSNP